MDKGNDDDLDHSTRTHRVVSIGHSETTLLNSASKKNQRVRKGEAVEATSIFRSAPKFCLIFSYSSIAPRPGTQSLYPRAPFRARGVAVRAVLCQFDDARKSQE